MHNIKKFNYTVVINEERCIPAVVEGDKVELLRCSNRRFEKENAYVALSTEAFKNKVKYCFQTK